MSLVEFNTNLDGVARSVAADDVSGDEVKSKNMAYFAFDAEGAATHHSRESKYVAHIQSGDCRSELDFAFSVSVDDGESVKDALVKHGHTEASIDIISEHGQIHLVPLSKRISQGPKAPAA